MKKIDDITLHTGLLNRDEEYLAIFIQEYEENLYICAQERLAGPGSEEDVFDCVSESITYIWFNIHLCNIKVYSIKAWSLMICSYRASNIFRKTKRSQSLLKKIEVMNNPISHSIEEFIIMKENIDNIYMCINSFRQDYKEVLLRKFFYRETPKEIAKALNLKTTKVYYIVYEYKKKLKEMLK